MTEVARRLGIGRSTLYRKLGELGIGDIAGVAIACAGPLLSAAPCPTSPTPSS